MNLIQLNSFGFLPRAQFAKQNAFPVKFNVTLISTLFIHLLGWENPQIGFIYGFITIIYYVKKNFLI